MNTATWRRGLEAGILLLILADVVLRLLGQPVLCSRCERANVHMALLGLGGALWTAILMMDIFQTRPQVLARIVGATVGVHLALVTYLLALPRFCGVCLATAALAVLVIGLLRRQHGGAAPIIGSVFLGLPIGHAVHFLMGALV